MSYVYHRTYKPKIGLQVAHVTVNVPVVMYGEQVPVGPLLEVTKWEMKVKTINFHWPWLTVLTTVFYTTIFSRLQRVLFTQSWTHINNDVYTNCVITYNNKLGIDTAKDWVPIFLMLWLSNYGVKYNDAEVNLGEHFQSLLNYSVQGSHSSRFLIMFFLLITGKRIIRWW